MLRNAWSDFRGKYISERDNNNVQVTEFIDFKQIQSKYVEFVGKLNDFKAVTSRCNEPLPEFSGKIEDWPCFISLFNEIVHDNMSVNKAYKIQFLKTSLKGEAQKIVSHISPTPDNYDICYNLLRNRYDNKRALLGKFLDNILLLPKQQYESSKDIKVLHDTVNECILSIKAMNIKTDNWDGLLNHIILHKLSSTTITNYECQLKNVKEPQTFLEFMTYLESRFLALQSAEAKNSSTEDKKKSKKPFEKPDEKIKQKTCLLCKGNHSLMTCKSFLEKSINDRVKWVNEKKLCNNCLSNSHEKNDCTSKFVCKICSKKHH